MSLSSKVFALIMLVALAAAAPASIIAKEKPLEFHADLIAEISGTDSEEAKKDSNDADSYVIYAVPLPTSKHSSLLRWENQNLFATDHRSQLSIRAPPIAFLAS